MTEKKTILQLCRELDEMDLSEINRRIASGEPFDGICNATMEQRVELSQELEKQLGTEFERFDKIHDAAYAARNPYPPDAIARIEKHTPRQTSMCGCVWLGSWRIEWCKRHGQVKMEDVLIGMIKESADEMANGNTEQGYRQLMILCGRRDFETEKKQLMVDGIKESVRLLKTMLPSE